MKTNTTIERFRKKFADPVKTLDHKCQGESIESFFWRDKIEKFWLKELALAEQRGREEALDLFDIELEAWMQVHDEQDRSFNTQSLVKHMKNALKNYERKM